MLQKKGSNLPNIKKFKDVCNQINFPNPITISNNSKKIKDKDKWVICKEDICILTFFSKNRRSPRRRRVGDESTRTSSTRFVRRSKWKLTWRQVENWAICPLPRPATQATTSSVRIAAGSSIRVPPSVIYPSARTCFTTNQIHARHRNQNAKNSTKVEFSRAHIPTLALFCMQRPFLRSLIKYYWHVMRYLFWYFSMPCNRAFAWKYIVRIEVR